MHSGFNVHRSRRVPPDEREDLERLVSYIIRNPFAVQNMQVGAPSRVNPEGSTLYRSGLNPNIQRDPSTSLGPLNLSNAFEVFTPCGFIATIIQHIPDKSLQLGRHYGRYSNTMRGRR